MKSATKFSSVIVIVQRISNGPPPESIGIHPVDGAEPSLRQLAHLAAHHGLAIVEQPLHRHEHSGATVFRDEACEAAFAGSRSSDAGPHVAERHIGQAHIRAQHVHKRLVDDAAIDQLHTGEV